MLPYQNVPTKRLLNIGSKKLGYKVPLTGLFTIALYFCWRCTSAWILVEYGAEQEPVHICFLCKSFMSMKCNFTRCYHARLIGKATFKACWASNYQVKNIHSQKYAARYMCVTGHCKAQMCLLWFSISLFLTDELCLRIWWPSTPVMQEATLCIIQMWWWPLEQMWLLFAWSQ